MTSSRADGGFLGLLLLFVLAMGTFFLLPGLLLVISAAAVLEVTLDSGQLWVFGGTVSGVVVLVAWLVRGPVFALGWYAGACLFSVWVMALAHWGMHADWPVELVVAAIPGVRG